LTQGYLASSAIWYDSQSIYKYAVAGALEVYHVTSCNQYPNGTNGVTQFKTQVYEPTSSDPNTDWLATEYIGWSRAVTPQNPSCGFDASWTPYSDVATLWY
jgi:hypothetical protein